MSAPFDIKASPPPQHPHFLQVLWEEFAAGLRKKLPTLDDAAFEDALSTITAQRFLTFALARLKNWRPVQSFPADDNYGLVMVDGKQIVVCPGGEAGGMSAGPKAVSITRHGRGDSIDGGSIEI